MKQISKWASLGVEFFFASHPRDRVSDAFLCHILDFEANSATSAEWLCLEQEGKLRLMRRCLSNMAQKGKVVKQFVMGRAGLGCTPYRICMYRVNPGCFDDPIDRRQDFYIYNGWKDDQEPTEKSSS